MERRKGTLSWSVAAIVIVSALYAVPARAATILPIVEYTSTSTLTDDRPFTLGYEFALSSSFSVNALGYWDDGLGNDHEVGIWTSSGTLVTSTTVLGSDPLTGHFRYHEIPTLILAPGSYVIAGEFLGNNDPFPYLAQGITSLPGYTWVRDLQEFGSGLNFPTTSTLAYGDNGIFTVNLSVESVTAVPEPASVLLIGSGLIGLLSREYRANRRVKKTGPALRT